MHEKFCDCKYSTEKKNISWLYYSLVLFKFPAVNIRSVCLEYRGRQKPSITMTLQFLENLGLIEQLRLNINYSYNIEYKTRVAFSDYHAHGSQSRLND
jgi:hypothetical protein